MANAPNSSASRLSRIPSYISVAFTERSDATTFNQTGAGRMLGALLSSSGARLEVAMSRLAQRVGFGPTAVVRRLLNLILFDHQVLHNQPSSPSEWPVSPTSSSHLSSGRPFVITANLSQGEMLQHIAQVFHSGCPRCRQTFAYWYVPSVEYHKLLARLLDHLKYVPSNQFQILRLMTN